MSQQPNNPMDLATTETRIAEKINLGAAQNIGTNASGALAFRDASQIMEFAKMMAIAQVAVPKHLRGSPGACLAVTMQANEWEMSPFAVANKSYSVNDRIAYEAQLLNAVILKRAPIKGRFKISYSGEGQQRKCKVGLALLDGEIVEYESPAIGTIKVKNSPLWTSDPDQQLFYFSSRSLCRRHFPDVLLGVYTPEEAEEIERDVSPVVQVNPQASKLLFNKPTSSPIEAAAASEVASGADQGAAELFPDDAEPVVSMIAKRLAAENIFFGSIRQDLLENGILQEHRELLTDCAPEELSDIWRSIEQVVKLAKKDGGRKA